MIVTMLNKNNCKKIFWVERFLRKGQTSLRIFLEHAPVFVCLFVFKDHFAE